ncbi:aminopeptidase [Thermodesulfobacteriota bacterium]
MVKKVKILILLAIMLLCSSCRLGYLIKAGKGQFNLISNSIPVEEALKSGHLTEEQKSKLRLVAEIKAFGEEVLGLSKTRNYKTAYVREHSPIYLISASPKDRLALKTWWFPLVGEMPYLGFFDLGEALREKARLFKEDLDVVVSKAEAYSTLGWFRDPVTLNLIDGSNLELVEIILHEMTHTTMYIEGQGEFNEGLASLVGKFGALLFMEQKYGSPHFFTVEARHSICDERLFSCFLSSLLTKIEKLYNSPLDYSEKLIMRKKIFESSLEQLDRIKIKFYTGRYERFGRYGLNNAYLLTVGLYHRNFNLFESILEKNGGSIKDMLSFLKGLEREGGDMLSKMAATFSEPLEPCKTIVKTPNIELCAENTIP